MDRANVAILLLGITGIVFSCASVALLIASQIQQYWIQYILVIAGSQTIPGTGTVTYTITTTADIGLWNTYTSSVYVYSPQVALYGLTNKVTTGTLDSATTGYFSEDSVKACRALAILTTILAFAAMIIAPVFLLASLKLPFSLKIRKSIAAALVLAPGSAAFLASLTLIVARTMFKSGMELNKSFNMGIAATILLVAVTFIFIILITISFKKGSPAITNQTGEKIQMQPKENKGDVTSVSEA